MNKNITILGAGNMGRAIIHGLLSADIVNPQQLKASVHTEALAKELQDALSISVFHSNREAIKEADIIILAVKPYVLPQVIEEIKPLISKETRLISIATGFTLEDAKDAFGPQVKFTRVMPNLAAQVGESMSGIAPNSNLSPSDIEDVQTIFDAIGKSEIVTEKQLDAVTGVSGSSPTLVFMMIEAMADAGVAKGLTRQQALTFAKQAIRGAATVALHSDEHPEALKDRVCTPSGTSIAVVREAEKGNFRSVIQEAIITGIETSEKLSQK